MMRLFCEILGRLNAQKSILGVLARFLCGTKIASSPGAQFWVLAVPSIRLLSEGIITCRLGDVTSPPEISLGISRGEVSGTRGLPKKLPLEEVLKEPLFLSCGRKLPQDKLGGPMEPLKNPPEQDQRVEEPASPWVVKASGECLKKDAIRKLFSDGKLGEALKQFKECALPEFQNLGTMLQARFSLINTHKIEGTISDHAYRFEWLAIGKALLQLLDCPDVFSK